MRKFPCRFPFSFRPAAACLALGLCGPLALANGINPPRPSGGQNLDAVCKDRASGTATTIRRVRVMVDQPEAGLLLRIGSQPARRVPLAEIARFDMPSPEVNAEGDASVTLVLLQPKYEGPGTLRLRDGGKPVRLVGFADSLTRVDLPLAACSEVVLAAPQGAGEMSGPPGAAGAAPTPPSRGPRAN